MFNQHVLSSDQFNIPMLEYLYKLADTLAPIAKGSHYTRVLEGAIMASLFFEPSTRTRLSFDIAFMRLGGSVSHTTGVDFSSIMKGESIADTARVISGYADILVIRHPNESAIIESAKHALVPVINGGNGTGEHPTQALLDLYTIRSDFIQRNKTINGTCIAMIGDLKYGRTIHSLIKLLSLYEKIHFILVSPPKLQCPAEYIALAKKRRHHISISSKLEDSLQEADVVYMTRVQQERMSDQVSYDIKNYDFRLDKEKIDRWCAHDALIMHPLPRDSRFGAQDLSEDVNHDPRLAIFRQSDAGVPVRMALFAYILGVDKLILDSIKPVCWRNDDNQR